MVHRRKYLSSRSPSTAESLVIALITTESDLPAYASPLVNPFLRARFFSPGVYAAEGPSPRRDVKGEKQFTEPERTERVRFSKRSPRSETVGRRRAFFLEISDSLSDWTETSQRDPTLTRKNNSGSAEQTAGRKFAVFADESSVPTSSSSEIKAA